MPAALQPIITDAAAQLAALRSVSFDWTRHLQSIWHDTPHDASKLNNALADDIVAELARCNQPHSFSPLGRVIVGPAGSGKTHLVGNLRKLAWEQGGWFVLLDLTDVSEFWATAALSYLQSLQQRYSPGIDQGDQILLTLCGNPSIGKAIKSQFREIFSGQGQDLVKLADAIVDALRHSYRAEAQRHRDVIRAFVMLQARDAQISDLAYSWLQGIDVEENIFGPPQSPRDVVRGLSWLMSLTGPTLLAVDQIDAIVSIHNHVLENSDQDGGEQSKALTIIDGLAGGLMDLRDVTLRTLTVLSSLEATWNVLVNRALKSATDRFHEPVALRRIAHADIAREIIVSRLTEGYALSGFHPPYPSWPFHPDIFREAIDWLPRTLLKRCDAHLRRCLTDGHVIELRSLTEPGGTRGVTPPPKRLEEKFRRLAAEARVDQFMDPEEGERLFPNLLLDALECYKLQTEAPDDVDLLVDADPHRRKPALHARLRRVHRSEGDREEHYCFRAIPHAHPRAFQSRLQAAITAAGIDLALPFRHLIIIRRDAPPSGPKTKQMCEDFRRAGGKFVALGSDGLKIMLALQAMLKERPDGFETWLKQRKPLCDISLFCEADLCADTAVDANAARQISPSPQHDDPAKRRTELPAESPAAANKTTSALNVSEPKRQTPPPKQGEPLAIPIGRRLIGGQPEQPRMLALNLLPRHTAILAGSGSGKTVLLRRIVEEAALLGVPAIVLDTNNDLARLGDPWPEVPTAFEEADRAKAQAYRDRIETVVWTPGISGGNPIMLAPMPAFAPVRGHKDELQQTVVMAYAALRPLVGASGAKAPLKEGVLMQALQYFARSGDEGLDPFVRLLSDLPPEVSDIDDAGKIATGMANLIKAEIAKNPLLSFKGTPLDPEALLSSGKSGRTRVSVINFSGLPADEAKQAFVNQLEMTLFSWIKKNPSPQGRPLTGLLVMDEAQNFAPSQKSTPCKESTVALVAQARKYGLGMIFATQVPKNIDNKIISNCTTHFYGKMNSPATIEATRELMAAKGGSGSDIASMKAGEFYFTTEGMATPEKLRTPLCLSHHPQNPLGQEDVVKRARASRMAA